MSLSQVNWGTSTLTYAGTQRVYVRRVWADPWEYQGNIWCEECAWSLLPAMPTASLRLDYGAVLPHGSTVWTTQAKLSIGGWYVKIEFDCADGLLVWYGFIDETADLQGGLTGGLASGQQRWVAYAMPQILALTPITRSRWWDERNSVARESGSAIAFNARGMPNRTDDLKAFEDLHIYMAADSSLTAQPLYWSTFEIVNYLVAFATPQNELGDVLIPFRVDNLDLLPGWDQPTLETEGRSPLSLLMDLVNPSRLLQFSTLVDESTDPHTVVLKVHSLSSVDIPLHDDYTHDANADVLSLTTLDAHDTQVVTQQSETGTVHQIVVKGALREAVATFKIKNDGTELLDESWTADQQVLYEDAASAGAGYAAMTSAEKRIANELVRSQARLHDVFRTFVITSEWDFLLPSTYYTFYIDEPDGSPSDERYFPYWNAINIRPQLPLKPVYDYSGTAIVDGVLDRGLQDFRSPYVLFKRPGLDQYHQAEKMANYNTDPMFSVEVGIDRDGQALTLHVLGAEQHAIAFNHFTQLPVETGDYLIWDYEECEITLSLQEDRFAESRYPDGEDLPVHDAIRRKVIYAGPGYELTGVIADAVVDVDQDGALKKSDGGYLHDDRARLASIAEIAASFWLVPRKVLRLVSARPSATPAVGMMVDVVNAGTEHEAEINTVISEIRLSTLLGEDGSSNTATYSIVTALGEFDAVAFVPAARH